MSQAWLLPDEVENYMRQWGMSGVYNKLRDATVARFAMQQNKRKFPAFNKLGQVQSNKAWMLVSDEVIAFLQQIIRSSGALRCLDLGTFTGMSALAMAEALPADGSVVTCDIDPDPVAIAQEFWQIAGLSHKISSHIVDACRLMQDAVTQQLQFDMVFLDAQNRRCYDEYYELILQLLPAGGSLVIDNAFMFGHVMDASSTHINAQHIKILNEKIRHDKRVTASMHAFADGVLWAVKV